MPRLLGGSLGLLLGCHGAAKESVEGATDSTDSTTTTSTTSTTTPVDECTAAPTSTSTSEGPDFSWLTESTWDTTTTTTTDGEAYAAMNGCPFAEPCNRYVYQAVEGGGDPWHNGLVDIERCVLSGLRDGTPGRYRYSYSNPNSLGSVDRDYIIHVRADRTMIFVEYEAKSNADTFNHQVTWTGVFKPARACHLASPAFFQGCIDQHNEQWTQPDCMASTVGWWSQCVEEEFTCPCLDGPGS